MTDFETNLRTGLREAADRRPSGDGLEHRIAASIDRRHRIARTQRVAAVAACVAVALVGAGLVMTANDRAPGTTSLASATPRSGSPGWARLAEAPISERFQHTAVSMDGEVLVFGGYRQDGRARGAAVYDPRAGRWRPAADPPGDMRSAVAAWTGDEVLALDGDGRLYAYDPEADEWAERTRSPLSVSGNAITSVVWTGDVLLAVQGMADDPSTSPVPPATYDPGTDTWTSHEGDAEPLPSFSDAVWTGDRLVVAGSLGGSGRSLPALFLKAFTPGQGWEELPAPPLESPDGRTLGFAVWTGTELVIGGGSVWSADAIDLVQRLAEERRAPTTAEARVTAPRPAADAAAWNPSTGTWRRLPDAPVGVTGLDRYAETWTGREVVAWEAASASGSPTGRLVLLDPATGTWRLTDVAPHAHHQNAPATWTGHELVVFSGEPTQRDTEPAECCSAAVAVAVSFTP